MCCKDLELICRARMAILKKTDRREVESGGGSLAGVDYQLVMVSGGLTSLGSQTGATKPLIPSSSFPQSSPLAFQDCFTKFLGYVRRLTKT